MTWDLSGKKVRGTYMNEVDIQGVVESSRIKYGGDVIHYVKLDEPKEIYGSLRDVVVLYTEELFIMD